VILFTARGSIYSAFSNKYDCKLVSARLTPATDLQAAIEEADVVIHNAANLQCSDLSQAVEDNFQLTRHLLDLAHRVKPGIRFINISSMSMLATADRYLSVEEMSTYAYSKYLSETYCLRHPMKEVISVRFATIFYKHPQKDGLSKLIFDGVRLRKINLINNGKACRDFVPVEIVADYLKKLAETEKLPGRKINICSGQQYSFSKAAQVLAAEVPQLRVDNTEAAHHAVLCAFGTEGVEALGRVTFELEDHIRDYIKKVADENVGI